MTETRMATRADNLAYLARGGRDYAARPVLGRERGVWELQWVFRGGATPVCGGRRVDEGGAPRLFVSHPASRHGWTDAKGRHSEVFVVHARSVPAELSAGVNPAETLIVRLDEREHRAQAARLDELWAMWRAGDGRLGLKLEQVLVEVALLVMGRGAPAAPLPSEWPTRS